MTAYTWSVVNVETTTDGNLQDVIKSVHWSYTGTTETGTAQIFGHVDLPPIENSETFIQFSQLTTAQVSAWVEALMSEDQLAGYQDVLNQRLNYVPPVYKTLSDFVPTPTLTDPVVPITTATETITTGTTVTPVS